MYQKILVNNNSHYYYNVWYDDYSAALPVVSKQVSPLIRRGTVRKRAALCCAYLSPVTAVGNRSLHLEPLALPFPGSEKPCSFWAWLRTLLSCPPFSTGSTNMQVSSVDNPNGLCRPRGIKKNDTKTSWHHNNYFITLRSGQDSLGFFSCIMK